MTKRHILRYALCVFLTVCVVWSSTAVSFYGYEENLPYGGTLYTDGVGGFYALEHNEKGYTAYRVSHEQFVSLAPPSAPTVTAMLCYSHQVYLIQEFPTAMGIYTPNRSLTEFTDDVHPQPDGIAITPAQTLYVTDKRSPAEIRIYTHFYQLRETVTAPAPVQCLFMMPDTSAVYALTEQGVFLPDSGELISCSVPAVPFTLNQGIACDVKGRAYRFDAASGFQPLLRTNHTPLCYAEGYFYTYTRDTVLQLDSNGEIIARYIPTGHAITAIAASGQHIAVLCGDRFALCAPDDFEPEPAVSSSAEPISQEPSRQENSSVTSLPVHSQPSVSSIPETHDTPSQTPTMTVTSDIYTITDHIISGIPSGTTLATLRNGLQYADAGLTMHNPHGAVVTNGRVGTGFRLHFDFDAQHTADYDTVVTGDLSGEGNVNTLDLRQFAQYLIGTQTLTPCQAAAADLNHDTQPTLSDLYLLQQTYYNG